MKLKDIATIAVLGVIGFALGMGVGMITGMFGALSMYVSAGFAAFFVGPVYTIMARKVQKRGTAFCFWLIYGVLYAIMGFAVRLRPNILLVLVHQSRNPAGLA